MANKSFLRQAIAVSAFLLLCCGMMVARRSVDADRDKRALLDLEDRWLASEDDPDALQNILADDFIHALPMGFVTKDEQLDYMRKIKEPPPHGARHFGEIRARVYGDAGIVNGIVAEDASNGGTRRTVFTDVFVRRNGRWQAVNAQELPFRSESTSTNP